MVQEPIVVLINRSRYGAFAEWQARAANVELDECEVIECYEDGVQDALDSIGHLLSHGGALVVGSILDLMDNASLDEPTNLQDIENLEEFLLRLAERDVKIVSYKERKRDARSFVEMLRFAEDVVAFKMAKN